MEVTNQLKKYIKSLHANKHRQKYNKFIAEGPKICSEFVKEQRYAQEYIICTSEWLEDPETEALQLDSNKLYVVKPKVLAQLSNLKTANKVLLVLDQKTSVSTDIPTTNWNLYLDRIQDPGNMGTILRIADWYGVSKVVASPDSVSFYNPKVVQSAMGAHNRLDLGILSFDNIIADNIPKYGLALNGISLTNQTRLDPGYLIIGNESKGIQQELLEACDQKLTIPRKGGAESLNAAVACGISCQILMNE